MMAQAAGRQEMETDVVVVGYGGAGAAAAITAHDEGARVTILEKMPSGGGNTRISAGLVFTPTSMEAVKYIERLGLGTTERETIETFVEYGMQIKDWIRGIGGELIPRAQHKEVIFPPMSRGAAFPNVPSSDKFVNLVPKAGEGESLGKTLWNLLSNAVDRRGIRVMTNTAAQELVTNRKGEVTGVVAKTGDGEVLVKAKKAVILTCGGFENNEALKEAFLPCKPFCNFGSPGNTGDGIIMAQKVGAALWHMTTIEGFLGFKAAEFPSAFSIRFHNKTFIYVNSQGKRYCNEVARENHDRWRDVSQVDSMEHTSSPGYPNIPTYGIFDEATRLSGALCHSAHPTGFNQDYYSWSPDNSREIAKGWISQANTIRELARRTSVDELSLEDTVARYNEYCKAGRDADFGRSKETLGSLEKPPFYAIQLWPGLVNTQGGPRRDKQARVVSYEGKPIPRLYAAGELGSIWGFLYNGGGNIAECICFGRIAGRNAAAEKPLR